MTFDDDMATLVRDLGFRPERSRPVWRNKHTGTEVVVKDLAINDHGGFQGGCRQHVVITDEAPPPGPPSPPPPRNRGPRGANVYALDTWLRNWEPVGRYIDWHDEPIEDEVAKWRERAQRAEARLASIKEAIG